MATRTSSIKLTLNSGSFNSEVRGLVGKVGAAGRMMGTALSRPLSAGFESAKKSLASFGGELKGAIKTAATLGGALSFGAAVKSAVDAKAQYVRIANMMSIIGERTVAAADVQGAVERAADRTKTSISDLLMLANQFAALSPDQMEEGLTRAAMQAKRFGVESTIVGRSYTRLIAKGVAQSVQEAEKLTEEINRFGRTVLGIDPDEAIDPMDVAEYAAFVRSTNSSITEMNALLAKTGSTAKDLGQAIEIVEELGLVLQTGKGIKELRKNLGLSAKDVNLNKTAVENLFTVIEKKGPKGFRKLQEAFGTDRARKAIQEIVGEDIVVKASTGKVTRQEWELRVGELRNELRNAGSAVFDWSGVVKANKDITNTANANLQAAMNRVTTAFSKPEMISAIERLADKLPVLATKLAEFIDWVSENPWKAASLAVGAKVGIPAIGAALGTAAAGMLKAAGSKLIAGGTAAAGGIATAAKGATAALFGAGTASESAVAAAAMKAAAEGGGAIATTAGGIGLATVAGGAAVAGIAAGTAYGGYKLGAEPAMDWTEQLKKLDNVIADATETLADRKSKAEDINAVLSRIRSAEKDFKPGMFVKMLSKATTMLGGEDSATKLHESRLKKLTQAEEELINALRRLSDGTGRAAGAMRKVGDAASSMPGTETGKTTRGVRKPASSVPGAVAVEG